MDQEAQNRMTRENVAPELKWDLSRMYQAEKDWEKDLDSLESVKNQILALRGKLAGSPEDLAAVMKLRDSLSRKCDLLYVFAHLKSDEDTSNSHYQGLQGRARSVMTEIGSELAWVEPEILAISDSALATHLAHSELTHWKRAIEEILRDKPHTLSEKEEGLLSKASDTLGAAHKIFSMLNNADLRFPKIKGEDGTQTEVTHGNYIKFMESRDRSIRKSAFDAFYSTYGSHKNTLAATLDSGVRTNAFYASVRKFSSALEASLFSDNVKVEVYDGLIQAVHENLPFLHRFMELSKNRLGLKELNAYDTFAPIIDSFDLKVSFEEAREWICESVRPLGTEYHSALCEAFESRWIDAIETPGKRSGAYSSGCYDSSPYILMNYHDNLNSAFTLAHELGHSLHSWHSNRAQPHAYSRYRIFVAEVASTTNEELLLQYLLRKAEREKDLKLTAYLLNHVCHGFKNTVYRQTQFAEFEKLIHERVESGHTLTADFLCEKYYEMVCRYYGPHFKPDDLLGLEWARVPHFYFNFYVYKYATGFSAAQDFADNILSGDPKKVSAYLDFLKGGSSKDPLDLLADAGVDLRTPDPVRNALKHFGTVVQSLETALKKIDH